MDNLKNDRYYVSKANENIKAIQRYIGRKTYEEFISDEELIDAIMFRLVQLIENIKNLSDEFKRKNDYVPWGKIMGFRNGIVHDYGKTDYTIVYEIVTQDLNELLSIFEVVF